MVESKRNPWEHGDRWYESARQDYEARQAAYADETDEERDAREARETREDLEKNG